MEAARSYRRSNVDGQAGGSRGTIPQMDGEQDESDLEQDNTIYDTSSDSSINVGDLHNDFEFKFLLANARSLSSKINSLLDAFGSLQLHCAAITETWFGGGRKINESIMDIEGATGIRIIHNCGDGRRKGNLGGGVAFAFNTNTCNFKRKALMPRAGKFEILGIVGYVGKIPRRVVSFVVYIPPNTKAADLSEMREAQSEEIAAARISYKRPLIIVGGDFNRRDISSCLGDTEPIKSILTGPTRGESTLDVVYTNFGGQVRESEVVPALQAENGTASDHRCVFIRAAFPPTKPFEWVVKYTHRRSKRADEAFCRNMASADWSSVREAVGVDAKAEALEATIARLTSKHFPLIRTRRRTNEAPWITHRIRRMWKRKCRIYKKRGRDETWWRLDRKMQDEIRESREEFIDQTLEDCNAGKSFYAAAKKLSAPGTKSQWSVSDLFAGSSPAQICDNVLDYFGSIAGRDGEVVPPPLVPKCEAGLTEFTTENTAKMLKAAKKTNSRVPGDPLPHLVRLHPDAFAKPVADTSLTRSTKRQTGLPHGRENI